MSPRGRLTSSLFREKCIRDENSNTFLGITPFSSDRSTDNISGLPSLLSSVDSSETLNEKLFFILVDLVELLKFLLRARNLLLFSSNRVDPLYTWLDFSIKNEKGHFLCGLWYSS